MSPKKIEAATKKLGILDIVDSNIVRVDSAKEKSGDQVNMKKCRSPKEVAAPVMEEKWKRRAKTIGSSFEAALGEGFKRRTCDASIPEKPETDEVKTGSKPKTVVKNEEPVPSKEDKKAARKKAKALKLAAKEGMKNENAAKIGKDEEDNLEVHGDEREELPPVDTVTQFTIKLDGTNPRIWRIFQVPSNYSFAELHLAIQCCMGWNNRHLHEFRIRDPETHDGLCVGTVANYPRLAKVLPEDQVKIAQYFTEKNRKAKYIYNFGDFWVHTITFDKVLLKKKNTIYPICVRGKLACPPEDVRGVTGFYLFLAIIKNPKHPEYKHFKECSENSDGTPYDPNNFNPKKVTLL